MKIKFVVDTSQMDEALAQLMQSSFDQPYATKIFMNHMESEESLFELHSDEHYDEYLITVKSSNKLRDFLSAYVRNEE